MGDGREGVVGGREGWVMGIEYESWVLYGNQFDNKFHIKKIKKNKRVNTYSSQTIPKQRKGRITSKLIL